MERSIAPDKKYLPSGVILATYMREFCPDGMINSGFWANTTFELKNKKIKKELI